MALRVERNIFYHIADYNFHCFLLADADVGLGILVCVVEQISFHFGLCSRKCVVCVFVLFLQEC